VKANLFWGAVLVAVVASAPVDLGCREKRAPETCDTVVDHARSLAPPDLQVTLAAVRDASIVRCEQLPAAHRTCILEATSLLELQSCR
jgi:hypothetical protein